LKGGEEGVFLSLGGVTSAAGGLISFNFVINLVYRTN
jgi:hypothetical protein